ncbi:DUF2066 domain-containing protein [Arsukibacterium sp.]|uniref:DUF2066 domain-containing protein n=1 Tax=Arsukibacterium sp. TaxID=1977258 RepID=UPI002FD94B69
MQKLACLMMCCLLWLPVTASEVANIYLADVSADQPQREWQRAALAQVLNRVSGESGILERPAIRAELGRAAGYVKQFEAVRHADGNRIRVLLDAERINQLLIAEQIPVWGAHRPNMLIWLVQQSDGQRQFIRDPEDPVLQPLKQVLSDYALPLTLPLYDIDDLLSLNETDVWAGFWTQIQQASQRYRPDEVIILMLEQRTSSVEEPWRLNWQRQQQGRTLRGELAAADASELLALYANSLVAELAAQYAVLPKPENSQLLTLQIDGSMSWQDLLALERSFSQILGVTDVTVNRYQADFSQISLRADISAEQLQQILQFDSRLQAQANRLPAFFSEQSQYQGQTQSPAPQLYYRFIGR